MDDKYFRHNRENVTLTLRMELSKELKMWCCFVVAFLEFVLNFEHFKNKNENKKERKNESNS